MYGIGASLLLIAAGAVLRWGVTVEAEGLNINMIGLILLVIGVIGLLISMIMAIPGRRSRDREIIIGE